MKQALKTVCNGLAVLLVLPCWLGYRLGSLLLGPDRAFPGWSQALSLLPGLSGAYLRRAFYRLVFPRCGPDSHISFGTVFSHPTAEVGRPRDDGQVRRGGWTTPDFSGRDLKSQLQADGLDAEG